MTKLKLEGLQRVQQKTCNIYSTAISINRLVNFWVFYFYFFIIFIYRLKRRPANQLVA